MEENSQLSTSSNFTSQPTSARSSLSSSIHLRPLPPPKFSIQTILLLLLMHLLLLYAPSTVVAEVADYGTVPKGSNPTLFDPVTEPVIQLDESTFNDTVFCAADRWSECSSFIVEFYSDWCGHCRAYAPLYKALAQDIRGWSSVLKVAAMNCADPMNEVTCRANGILFFPYIKYFPRNSSNANYSVKLRPYQSQVEMRDQITQILVQDYAMNHFPDWPLFDRLGDLTTHTELWEGAGPNVTSMAVVFESDANSMVGAQLLLDLANYRDRLLARRCLKGHPLADVLHITDYPTLAVFRRGERVPILVAELRRLLLSELEHYLRDEGVRGFDDSRLHTSFGSRKNHSAPARSAAAQKEEKCATPEEVDQCKAQYYVSELDMLKALRYALVKEVSRSGTPLAGKNLTALHSFLNTLAHNFPHTTTVDSPKVERRSNGEGVHHRPMFLNASGRARVVFTHMRNYIEQRGLDQPLAVEDWQAEFGRAEEDQGLPFPTNSDWEHCKGSSPQFRGYTCGLWTAFHAITVKNYMDHRNESGALPTHSDPTFQAISTLQALRDYISNFFGCEHCRRHFLKMTTKTARIETHVRRREDGFLYLWKAHNMVNSRLRGRDTEDPDFPKFNFPAAFLCPECRPTRNTGVRASHVGTNGEQMDERAVKEYLLHYYRRIRPIP